MIKDHIFYNQNSTHVFTDYGIQIPLLNERIAETVSALALSSRQFPEITIEDLALAHSKEFIERVENDPVRFVEETYELVDEAGNYNRYDPSTAKKPLTDFIEKAKLHVGGTYLAAKKSLNTGFSYHLGGGMHHAMSMKPGGFCMFNDIVIAIRKLQKQKLIKKAAVIDLDCHKGDGTAEITKDDESITTLSIHMKNGWPLDGDPVGPSFIPSNYDIPIGESQDYMALLEEGVKELMKEKFDLVIVVHGVDVWEHDALPSSAGIKLTKAQILERDLFVHKTLNSFNLSQAWCLGGGYGAGISELYIQFISTLMDCSKYTQQR